MSEWDDIFMKLEALKLYGMQEALSHQLTQEDFDALSFTERVSHLVNTEFMNQKQTKTDRLIRNSRFSNSQACMEEIDYKRPRHFDRMLVKELATCAFIERKRNAVILGPTGSGKTYIAQALGHEACRKGYSTRFIRMDELLEEYQLANLSSLKKGLLCRRKYERFDLLIIDEWLTFNVSADDAQFLLRLINTRLHTKSTIVVSQFGPHEWLQQIPIQVAAESLTDRLATGSYKLEITSETSMREVYFST